MPDADDRYLPIEEIIGPGPKRKGESDESYRQRVKTLPKPILPMSRTKFYSAIRAGLLPKPTKIGKTSRWSEKKFRAALEEISV